MEWYRGCEYGREGIGAGEGAVYGGGEFSYYEEGS